MNLLEYYDIINININKNYYLNNLKGANKMENSLCLDSLQYKERWLNISSTIFSMKGNFYFEDILKKLNDSDVILCKRILIELCENGSIDYNQDPNGKIYLYKPKSVCYS